MRTRFSLMGALVSLFLAGGAADAPACTNFIAGKNATTDGSVMVTYADDSYTRFGYLHHAARGKHAPGEMRQIIDWGDNTPRGAIPQAAETYNVVGNMNEHQLVIGETTWGGHKELEDTTGNSILDYGSLIYVTLERAKTAREAIKLMGELTDKYGYASSGETFSIADKDEAWIMEMIGKGSGEIGANWIAVRIPDNAIAAHANEPRVRKVDYKDRENVIYSKDLFKWARKNGYFSGKDEDFSFADVYSDHPASKRRSCDGRVWSFYRNFATPEEDARWLGWVTAQSDEPLPLYIIPDRKLSLKDMQDRMRDHYEGTPLDMTHDIGAGDNKAPVRWRPNKFVVDGKTYFHERPTATQQTAWHFVTQSYADRPDELGVIWFGTDDANTSVYMPFYCSMTEVPMELQEGNGDLYNFSPTSNFWVNNWVANQVYHRYDLMIDDVRNVQGALERKFAAAREDGEEGLLALYKEGNKEAFEKGVNEHGARIAKEATDGYRDLAQFLLVRYMDGNKKKMDADGEFARNKYGKPLGPESPGYKQETYDIIVKTTGDRYLLGN